MAVFRYNTSVHEDTGITPLKAMFGIEAFEFEADIGWRTIIGEQNEGESLPNSLRILHDEL
jgi:hypothetical protein